jgi:hypothetical protein
VFRNAAWVAGAARAGRGIGGQVDLAALFGERSLRLLAPRATLAFLVPAKLWRSLAGGGVRTLLATDAHVTAIEDFSEAPSLFEAAVYPSLLVARRREGGAPASAPPVAVALHRAARTLAWSTPAARLPLADLASPWLLLPEAVRTAFDALAAVGTTLAESALGRPTLGVKCGCNDAFVVQDAADANPRRPDRLDLGVVDDVDDPRRVSAGTRRATLPGRALRPHVRGEGVAPGGARSAGEFLVWTHDSRGAPLSAIPAAVAAWLAPHRAALERRVDRGSRTPWWALFRTEGAAADVARVVWADIGRRPRAAVLPPGDPSVPLNSCYVVRCPTIEDAHALAALLNSPLAAAWLNAIAEPARGGYHRYLAWTTALLPIPSDWPRARARLAPIGERARAGDFPAPTTLLAAARDAYGIAEAAVAPLIAWHER